MKRIAFVVGLVVLVFGVAVLAQTGEKPKGQTAEQELLKLEQEWTNADLKDDWATMDRILADDYVLTDRDGFVSTKAQVLAYMKSGEGKILTLAIDDMKVRVYGDAAVVTLRATIKETYKGEEISDVVRITNTWIKNAGRWQCVATHGSRIAGK
jgi:ketosteroid isomerase-like protein